MNQSLTDYQQMIMVKEQLNSVGLKGEEPWICVKCLIDVLLEHEKDIVSLKSRLHKRIKCLR